MCKIFNALQYIKNIEIQKNLRNIYELYVKLTLSIYYKHKERLFFLNKAFIQSQVIKNCLAHSNLK